MPPPSPTARPLEPMLASLRLFRFRHALGGHANDGDTLDAKLSFASEAELVALFERMGRPLVVLPADAPVPVAGASYTIEEYEQLRHPVRAHPRYEAPGRTSLFGVSVYVAITREQVSLSLSGAGGDPYLVTERDVDNALLIEGGLRSCGLLPE